MICKRGKKAKTRQLNDLEKMASIQNYANNGKHHRYYLKVKGSLGYRYNECKKDAKKRNLEFNIARDRFDEITQKPCYYCDSFAKGKTFSGIDRINSSKGYVKGNIRPCCTMCNVAKSIYSTMEYIKHCARVFRTYQKRSSHERAT